MRKLLIGVILSILANTLFVGLVFANPCVHDVKTSTLNIRSGAGTSYSIIAQVIANEDVLAYQDVGGTVSANGYTWMRIYYPSASIGKYSSSALGWGAWYKEVTPISYNFHYTSYVVVTSSTPIYEYKYPNLTSPYPMAYNNGQNIGCYDSPLHLQYQQGYPNAWRLYRLDGSTSLGYGNGWKLNAKSN